jgi:metal-responsive CopG/Arc/MetJ family transcriptional regulator
MLQKKHNSGVLKLKLVWSKNMATNKKRITVSLTEDQYSTLEKLAKEKGFSKSAILALALEDYSRKELEQKK